MCLTNTRTRYNNNELISLHFIAPKMLKPTEEYDPSRAKSLIKKIETEGVWLHPLLVENNNYTIMDGHHRHQAAKTLGLLLIPCFLLSYDNPHLKLSSRRQEKEIYRQDIIKAGLTGNLLPYKSTRHQLLLKLPETFIPLVLLMQNNNFESPGSFKKLASIKLKTQHQSAFLG
jgi:hypothetical protein